jgi:3-hydroxyacyl-CoA dehydrogenase/enoyl-CoA hydratase/3-hydroxybutyryl-CoA epimerase
VIAKLPRQWKAEADYTWTSSSSSYRSTGFLAGADITMLQAVHTEKEAADLARTGQRAMDRIAAFRVPVVAAIHGAALGGGLEVAMACHARVASDDKKTKLGLPEVMLGVLPGAGGTQRLPALVPIQTALDMLLTGKQIDAKKAKKLGLVDEVVPQAILIDVACKLALSLASKPRSGTPQKKLEGMDALQEAALTKTPVGRSFLFDQARKQLLAKSRGNYPSPERILEVVRVIDKRVGAPVAAECFVDHSPPPPPPDMSAPLLTRDRATGRPTKKDRRQIDRFRRG